MHSHKCMSCCENWKYRSGDSKSSSNYHSSWATIDAQKTHVIKDAVAGLNELASDGSIPAMTGELFYSYDRHNDCC